MVQSRPLNTAPPATDSPTRQLVRASAVLVALFVVALILEHVLQPGLSPGDHRISEYATGSPGWLMTVGFAAWSAALLVAAAGALRARVNPQRAVAAVGALLAVAAAAAAVTSAFKTGTSAGVVPRGHRLTTANRIHDVGSGALTIALSAAAVASLALADRRLRAQAAVVLTCATAMTVLFSTAVDLPGVRQRVLVAAGCVWQLLFLRTIDRA